MLPLPSGLSRRERQLAGYMLPLPSGLSRRERQLAGYTRTLRNTFPEHSWLSVGPVPAGARLAG